MNRPKITEPHKPVLAWQRGPLRIVARERVCEHGEAHGFLVLEERCRDCMGQESWLVVNLSDVGVPAVALLCEIVARVDAIPKWVRDLVQERAEALGAMDVFGDDGVEHEHGGDGGAA